MEALSLVLLALASFAVGLMVAAWLVGVAAYKRGYRDASAEVVQLRWQIEALTSRLQVAGAQTMF